MNVPPVYRFLKADARRLAKMARSLSFLLVPAFFRPVISGNSNKKAAECSAAFAVERIDVLVHQNMAYSPL
jgi:hypothetical protein